MKLRSMWVLLLVVVVVACGGAAEEPAEDTTAPATDTAPMDDGAALDEQLEYFVTHYNMHHPDMVAELYAENAVFMSADGGVHNGREAIAANMTEFMGAAPTLELESLDRVISGNWAVSRGNWNLEMTPEGATEAVASSGQFMSVYQKMGEDWRTMAVISSYDAPPAEGTPTTPMPAEAPDVLGADNPLGELADFYQTHWNMGHGDVVASRYAEDAVAAFADEPWAEGRAAIAGRLNATMEELQQPQITIHTVGIEEIGDGWVVGGGWYEMDSDLAEIEGTWMLLARPGDDGNMQIHWAVSNGQQAAPAQ